MTEITSSVGRNAVNRYQDVRVVQELLLARDFTIGEVDGVCGERTIGAIVTFQSGFMPSPDGRVDPGGKTLRRLNGASPTPTIEAGSLTRLVPRPDRSTINHGITAVSNQTMLEHLGEPRDNYGADCQPITNPRLARNMKTTSVGPFVVTGLTPAVMSLQQVMQSIQALHGDVYRILGTAGMLCCRFVRNSTSSISNHSWGTAVDLKLNRILDPRGDDQVQYGLTLIAPVFNHFGWYWGAGFSREDAMHFEAGRALIETWADQLS